MTNDETVTPIRRRHRKAEVHPAPAGQTASGRPRQALERAQGDAVRDTPWRGLPREPDDAEAFLTIRRVVGVTGLAASTLYNHIKHGLFPKPIKVGPRQSRWLATEVRAWMDEKINAGRE